MPKTRWETWEGWREAWREGRATSVGVGFRLWAEGRGWTEVERVRGKQWEAVTRTGERVLVRVVAGKDEALEVLLQGRRLVRSQVGELRAGVRTLLWSPEEELEVGKELVR